MMAGTGPLDALIAELSEIADGEARTRFVLDHQQLHSREAVERLSDRVASLVFADLGRAERLAEA